jgi:hypothetical protein
MADELDPVRVLRALARPGLGDELHALGVRDLSSFGGADVYVPPQHEVYVRGLIDQAFPEPTLVTKRRRRRPGRTTAPVLEAEANKAARIYIRDRGLSPYAVWTRYNPKRVKRADDPKLLSKNMVAHLVEAIDHNWLPWDAARNQLVISGEFRAGRGRLVIPRRKPAS